MLRHLLVVIVILLGVCTIVAAGSAQERIPPPSPASGGERNAPLLLPGIQPGGAVLLPNQWSLRPAGRQLALGDFPVNLALHPTGRWLAVLHAGYGEHEAVIVDLQSDKIVTRVAIPQTFYGLCFAPDGRTLFASGGEFEVVHSYQFEDGSLFRHKTIAIAKETEKFVPGGLAVDAQGKTLFAAGTWGDAVCVVPLESPEKRASITLEQHSYPYAIAVDPAGKRLFVSLWNRSAIAVLDVTERRQVATWPTEKHPTEMALSPDGKTLFVACANSTKVSVLDVASGKGLETISCSLYPTARAGNTPSSLCLTPDGQLLLVANADANNLAVFNVAQPGYAKPLGFIPVGWYPTCVRFHPAKKRIYVANAKGMMSLANPQGPNPLRRNIRSVEQYIAGLFRGTLGVIELPTPDRMAEYSKQAYACSPLRADERVSAEPAAANPIPQKAGDASPIKHVLYIIKENRTYDQIFGDMKEGNGDPNLCLFPEKITPNHHRLARQFVLLDNFYCEGEVSADGHEWSMGAYATDFVEKVWPLVYRSGSKKKLTYPAEGHVDAIARPAGGYIWDRCAEAGVSYRSYGEWIINGKTDKDPGKASVKALEEHFDPWFRGFDLDYPDQKRVDRFLEELARFEKEGELPRFTVLRLPNDHTAGTRVGKATPIAMVADNDLALGRLVEAVSKSTFWKDTAIFVVEDDAQNGSDHVDAHRTVALVISPYAKRGQVDSTLYSTSSMLRTMELILGLQPMSQFDAAARPMYNSFQVQGDARPYEHTVPETDLKATNLAGVWGAEISERFDLTKEDAADDLLLGEVIWRSVRGADSPMPAPVRAAFVFPHLKPEKDKEEGPSRP
ncbi:MAG TPA: bifunctional YncE family protein/alkaline phosphatase family protein [Gemmataceae bacterium]|nr:bifunctional YncE family protein/alkaline phosphatase family protein [Gemmataceae bacterium]